MKRLAFIAFLSVSCSVSYSMEQDNYRDNENSRIVADAAENLLNAMRFVHPGIDINQHREAIKKVREGSLTNVERDRMLAGISALKRTLFFQYQVKVINKPAYKHRFVR